MDQITVSTEGVDNAARDAAALRRHDSRCAGGDDCEGPVFEDYRVTAEPGNYHTEYEYALTGAPDTRGPSGPNVTIRPETLRVRVASYRGEQPAVSSVSVHGRTIRRDGSISTYRDNGWTNWTWEKGILPPEWILEILRADTRLPLPAALLAAEAARR